MGGSPIISEAQFNGNAELVTKYGDYKTYLAEQEKMFKTTSSWDLYYKGKASNESTSLINNTEVGTDNNDHSKIILITPTWRHNMANTVTQVGSTRPYYDEFKALKN